MNGDGVVDGDDTDLFIDTVYGKLGSNPLFFCRADMDSDGDLDGDDVMLYLCILSQNCPPAPCSDGPHFAQPGNGVPGIGLLPFDDQTPARYAQVTQWGQDNPRPAENDPKFPDYLKAKWQYMADIGLLDAGHTAGWLQYIDWHVKNYRQLHPELTTEKYNELHTVGHASHARGCEQGQVR